jgi:DNA processing protein
MTNVGSAQSLLHPLSWARLNTISPSLEHIYWQGNASLLAQQGLAIVGSRRASAQGLVDAKDFAVHAATRGMSVISGLAVGVDAAAHMGALSVAGHTIAVLAHGLDQTYPKRHQWLLHQILESGGLLVSEYPDGTPPRPYQFPLRNRLIAGLSRGICLIEAARGSGSIITALYGLEMGVDVSVVPGSIHDPLFEGGLGLIRQGAGLVRSANEWLEDLGLAPPPRPVPQPSQLWDADDDPRADGVIRVLSAQAQGLEALCESSGLSQADVQAGLLVLELQGQAHRTPQGCWQRLVRPGVF